MDLQYSQRLQKIEDILRIELPVQIGNDWARRNFEGLSSRPAPEQLRSLTEPCRDLLNRGGKRWRPLLMTLVCEALGGGDAAVPLSPLVEFTHNATLVHDDIEDNSDERRGKPAVHILYGVDTAINSGSFLFFLAASCIDKLPVNEVTQLRVYRIWAEHMRRVHLGQSMDISWHKNHFAIPGLEEYNMMCRLKTGVLSRMAAQLGAVLAGVGTELVASVGNHAESLGVGFQILDDVKNLTTGNPGKRRGDDIVEGKKSLPVLLMLHDKPGEFSFVRSCFAAARANGIQTPEIEQLIRSLGEGGYIDEAARQGQALLKSASEGLQAAVRSEDPERALAAELLERLVSLIS